MNDYLLESKKKPRSSAENLRLNQIDSEHFSTPLEKEDTPRSPTKNSTAYKVLTVERQAKTKVTFNNIRLILIFSIVPFALIISAFGNIKLFIMYSNDNIRYWVNFLFIQKQIGVADQSALDNGAQTIYTELIIFFFFGGCKDPVDPDIIPANFCGTLASYYYSGLFASIAIALGVIFHIVHFWQLARLICKNDTTLIRGLNPLIVSYFVVFLYIGSFIYWLFASASIINSNSTQSPMTRVGSGFICYIVACALIIVNAIWLRRVYKKGVRRNLVDNLLGAEKKYIDSLDSMSVDVATERENQ